MLLIDLIITLKPLMSCTKVSGRNSEHRYKCTRPHSVIDKIPSIIVIIINDNTILNNVK